MGRGRQVRAGIEDLSTLRYRVRDHEAERPILAQVPKEAMRDSGRVYEALSGTHLDKGLVAESRFESAVKDQANSDNRVHMKWRNRSRAILDQIQACLPTRKSGCWPLVDQSSADLAGRQGFDGGSRGAQ
jgi:glycerol-3-phosphate O-acyltransferase